MVLSSDCEWITKCVYSVYESLSFINHHTLAKMTVVRSYDFGMKCVVFCEYQYAEMVQDQQMLVGINSARPLHRNVEY